MAIVKFKLIYIEWCDAISHTRGWMTKKEAFDWAKNEDWIVRQAGFLMEETKEYILLASRINPQPDTDDGYNTDGLFKIPKTWIRKRTLIRKVSFIV